MKSFHVKIVALAILAVVAAIAAWTMFYRVDATEVAVFQAPFTGNLSVESSPGTYMRVGAGVHSYRKQDNYDFEWAKDNGRDKSILVQFNDGGKANIGGNVQWEMPTDQKNILALHVLYGSQEGVDKALMRNAINRAMIFTAPLMSATESYAARRAEFLTIFADQLENGIYQMQTVDTDQVDPITNERKKVKIVSIQRDTAGNPIRAEESPLKKYGITIQPPTITHIVYEEKVEAQIQQQRDNTLAIQTSQAEAKKAEQSAITAAKNGEAKAVAAKWDQEVLKAKAVTEAEQQRDVAALIAARDKAVAETAAQRDKSVAETAAQRDLDVSTLKAKGAEQYKLQQTLEGQGDAAKRSLVMAADGALTQKLDAWLKSQEYWASAFGQYKGAVVPSIQTGAAGPGASNAAADFMNLMSMRAAQELSLDIGTTQAPVKGK